MEEIVENDMRFCPHCGYEGADIECPVCQTKMESLNAEVEKLAEAEQEDKTEDLTDPLVPVSLEEEAEKEESE